jgi:hypothetical protein
VMYWVAILCRTMHTRLLPVLFVVVCLVSHTRRVLGIEYFHYQPGAAIRSFLAPSYQPGPSSGLVFLDPRLIFLPGMWFRV